MVKLLDKWLPKRQIKERIIKDGPAKGCHIMLNGLKSHQVMLSGEYESFIYKDLPDLHGKVVWDVGAWIGYHSLCFANLGAFVYAFDPAMETYCKLTENISINQSLCIFLFRYALSNTSGYQMLYTSDNFYGESSGNHLEGMKGNENPESLSVPVVVGRGDKAFAPIPDLIKIDVEGAELNVLQGMGKLLNTHPIIILEVHSYQLLKWCCYLLRERGYKYELLKHEGPNRIFLKAVKDE